MADTESCRRCGGPFDAQGCMRCGLPPPGRPFEESRQRWLVRWLREEGLLKEGDPRLDAWLTPRAATALPPLPSPPVPAPHPVQHVRPDASAASDPPVSKEAAPPDPVPPPEPWSPPPLPPVERPRRWPARTPKSERQPAPEPPSRLRKDLLARRMEVAGWFLGVLFSVGGALWGTNVFWGSWAAATRLAAVALGLAVYACGFLAGGAFVAARYPESRAGAVLSLVGRLVAAVALLPLARLRHESIGTALPVDALVLALVAGALRLAQRQQHADTTRDGLGLWLAGSVLVLLAPGNEPLAVLVAAGAVVLVDRQMARRDTGARRRWLEDVAVAGLSLVALFNAAGFAEDAVASGRLAALVLCGLTGWFAAVGARLVARELPAPLLLLVRWGTVLAALGCSLASIIAGAGDAHAMVFAAAAVALACALLWTADRGWLAPRLRPLAWAAGSAWVGVLVRSLCGGRGLDLPAAEATPLALAAAYLFLGAISWHVRRGVDTARGPSSWLRVTSWSLAAVVFAVATGGGRADVLAWAALAGLVLTDRFMVDRPVYAFAGVGAVVALGPVLGTVWGLPREAVLLISAVTAAALAVTTMVAARVHPPWPLRPTSSATLVWLALLGLEALVLGLPAAGTPAGAWVAGAVLLLLGEVSGSVVAAVAGAVLLGLGWSGRGDPAEGPAAVLERAAQVTAVFALAGWLPRLAGARRPLLVRALDPWRAPDAARVALRGVAVSGAALLLAARAVWLVTGEAPRVSASAACVLALAAVFAASRDRVTLALLAMGSAVLAVEAGTAWAPAYGPAQAWGGLAGLATCAAWAFTSWGGYARGLRLPRALRFRRRRTGRATPLPLFVWAALVPAGACLALVVLSAASMADSSRGAVLVALGLTTTAAVLLPAFLAAGWQWLLAGALACVALALGSAASAAILGQRELPALAFAVGTAAWLAWCARASRRAYAHARRPRPAARWMAARPAPAVVRWVPVVGLPFMGLVLLAAGGWMYAAAMSAMAQRYLAGLAVVAAAVVGASLLLATRHRVLSTALVSLVSAAAGVTGAALAWRATGWLPPPTGMGQVGAAAGAVVAVLLVDRRWGRRLLGVVALRYPRLNRAFLRVVFAVAACALVGIGATRVTAPTPAVFLATALAGSAVLAALALVFPVVPAAVLAVIGLAMAGGLAGAHAGVVFAGLAGELVPRALAWGLAGAAATVVVAEMLARAACVSRAFTRLNDRLGRRGVRETGARTRQVARLAGILALGLGAALPDPAFREDALAVVVLVVAGSLLSLRAAAVPWALGPAAAATWCVVMRWIDATYIRGDASTGARITALVALGFALGVHLVGVRAARRLVVRVGVPLHGAGARWMRVALAGAALASSAVTPFIGQVSPDDTLAMVLAGVAGMVTLVGLPRPVTAVYATAGLVVAAGAVADALAAAMLGAPRLSVATLPAFLAGGLAACVAVQGVALHAARHQRPAWVGGTAGVLRRSAHALGLGLLLAVVGGTLLQPGPAVVTLVATWTGLGFAMVLCSRMAVAGRQTLVGALAHGAVLAIYVDLRRRTSWLDGIPAVDSWASLGAAVVFMLLRSWKRLVSDAAPLARAAELYASTLPIMAATLAPSRGGSALVLLGSGALYGVMARTRHHPAYELAAGAALLAGTTLGLLVLDVKDLTLFLMPFALVGTFLARRHRRRFGTAGRYLAVAAQVPVYVTGALSALDDGTMLAFAVAIVSCSVGVVYAFRARDRRSLYAAVAAATVLVCGRLFVLGTENRPIGVVLLVGLGLVFLGGMTAWTLRREQAYRAIRDATDTLRAWDGDDGA
ncbi:MAG: hypothetical protein HY904_10750 [Deltaproteobacteria bacterium]|nr:hypothetical protein [Deltaproteobacteria bacterium]